MATAFIHAEASRDDLDRVDSVAVKALARVFRAWKVAAPDAARLIAVSPRTWTRMRTGDWSGRLGDDQRLRASGLVGTYKALHLYFGEAIADRWVRMPNRGPLFAGATPIAFMLEGGLPAILEVRNYLDAVRGGV
jgi:uncharacterized protein (DUF2384 family)